MTLETLEKGKVQYTAKTHTTDGRAGASRSDYALPAGTAIGTQK